MIPSLTYEKLVWELEGLGDLNLKLLDCSGWRFNFSRMLHNSLCLKTNAAVH
jgi:hypothetical protein